MDSWHPAKFDFSQTACDALRSRIGYAEAPALVSWRKISIALRMGCMRQRRLGCDPSDGGFECNRLITIVTAEVASFKLVAEDKVAIEVGRSVKKENSY
jgi:hypothetical protein